MQLGQTIVKIRKDNGLTQEDFANKYNVTRQTVSNWENEKSYPDLLTLVKISDDFGISLDTMLKENPTMTEEMNKDMRLGKILMQMHGKGLVIAIVGFIACIIMFILSIIAKQSILMILLWGWASTHNLNAIISYQKVKKAQQEQSI